MPPRRCEIFMKNKPFSYTIKKDPKIGHTVITLRYQPASPKYKPMSIQVAPELGSNMFSLEYDGPPIISCDQKLLRHCGFTGNFVLFPTPNRVTDFTYTWGDRQIALTKSGKTVLIHGLVLDEPWEYTRPRALSNGVTFTTSITITKSSPLFKAYPFPCKLS